MADQQNLATPRFSIHVATHSDPPHLVIRTLQALLNQDWPSERYEIIVMDNNTTDPALWRRVESFCAAWPDRIRFLHQMDVSGAKAGAPKFGVGKLIGDPDYASDMPVYEEVLTDDEIIAVLSYIKSTWPQEVRARHDDTKAQQ